MKKEKKADQNAVAELTREGLYKENKWLWEENRKLKEEIINNAKDYVKLFKKYAVTSILLLISLIMNFILIIL